MLHYNAMTGYNKARYNADGVELSAADGITVADDTVTKSGSKTYSALIVLSDSTAKQQNKAVVDVMRIGDWIRIRNEQAEPWSD